MKEGVELGKKKAVRKKKVSVKERSGKSSVSKKSASSSKKGVSNHADMRADEVVSHKRAFFKEGSKRLKISIYGVTIALIISSISVIFAVNKESKNLFFAADEAGQYIELIPMSQPNHKSTVVSQWLTDALIDTFDFNYINMKSVLNKKSQVWFTPSGRDSLLAAISEDNSFSVIQKEKFIVQLNMTQAPVLIREGNDSVTGKYEWIYQMPATFTYTNEKETYINHVIFTVQIVRRSMLEDLKGLGINKLIVEFTDG